MLYIFATFGLLLTLGRLIWIDLHSLRLPDRYTLPLIAAGLALAPFPGGASVLSSVMGGGAGYGLFWLVGHLYFARNGIDGLGLGDAKLFAASGTWLGVGLLPYILLIASVGGLLYIVIRGRGGSRQIAFGPWLALGFVVVWLHALYENIGAA